MRIQAQSEVRKEGQKSSNMTWACNQIWRTRRTPHTLMLNPRREEGVKGGPPGGGKGILLTCTTVSFLPTPSMSAARRTWIFSADPADFFLAIITVVVAEASRRGRSLGAGAGSRGGGRNNQRISGKDRVDLDHLGGDPGLTAARPKLEGLARWDDALQRQQHAKPHESCRHFSSRISAPQTAVSLLRFIVGSGPPRSSCGRCPF